MEGLRGDEENQAGELAEVERVIGFVMKAIYHPFCLLPLCALWTGIPALVWYAAVG